MSAFDELVTAVWAEARQDDGALLAEFAAPASDAGRARRALRLPQLAAVRRRLLSGAPGLRQGKDPERAARALARAEEASGAERHLDAVLALSEAVRFAPARSELLLRALESRSEALLRLRETAASLRDLDTAREVLRQSLREADSNAHADQAVTLQRLLRTLLSTAARLEQARDRARAEAVLREALTAVRDAGDLLAAPAKTEAVGDIMQRLKKLQASSAATAQNNQVPPAPPPLASSGLDALPKLYAGAHPTLPAASAALEVREDAARGRHLVATQHIPAGSALIVERPFAWSLALEEMTSHCLHCCGPVLAAAPCPSCSEVVFCGAACRDAALPAYHLAECGLLGQLLPRRGAASELSPMALLAFRIVVQAAGLAKQLASGVDAAAVVVVLEQAFVELHQEQEGEAGKKKKKRKKKTGSTGYDAVFAQVTHSDRRTPADLLKRSLTAAFLTSCLEAALRARPFLGPRGEDRDEVLDEEQRVLLTAAFLRHLQGCSCNAYQISEQRLAGGSVRGARGVELGGACLPTVSLVNHACSPNVARHSHGNVCVVRAARAIPKGGELLDNYGPHFLEHDAEERRAVLAKQYMFQCECEACANDWPALEDLEPQPPQPPQQQQQGRKGKRPSAGQQQQQQQQQQQLADLAARMRAGVQGLLEGRLEEAERSALKYSTALAGLQQPRQPPCGEQVRADQVVALCWSLAGNAVRY